VNIANNVNIEAGHAPLCRALRGALERLLHETDWLQNWRVEPGQGEWDLIASGPLSPTRTAVVCVECKGANFQPSQFTTLVERRCAAGKPAVSVRALAMPRVSPRMAALCRQHDWSWYDLAGNCRLEIPGLLLIERSGREAVTVARRPAANLSTAEAARVVRALLAPEHAGKRWTQREMVGHFAHLTPAVPAPSLALVNKVVQHLRDQAFIEPLPTRGFRVHDFEGLLLAWRQAYRFDRHVWRPYFTLLPGKALQERLRAFDPEATGRVAYAAFSAADVQAPTVRQAKTWVYLRPDLEGEFASALDARVVDSGENMVVLLPDDDGVFYQVDRGVNRAPCTNVVQTYLDVAKSGARGEDAAEAILNQRLKPAWAGAR